MVTRYSATDSTLDSTGDFVSYPDYRLVAEQLNDLQAAVRALVPVPVKTADEQAVTDFVLNLARKVK